MEEGSAHGSDPVVKEGKLLKLNRWKAWQDRWATVTRSGHLVISRTRGGEATASFAPNALVIEYRHLGERGARWKPAIIINNQSSRKMKIVVEDDAEAFEWMDAFAGHVVESSVAQAA